MGDSLEPRLLKIGVKFDPPCLLLQFKVMKITKIRSMPIRDLKKSTDCYKLAKLMKARHEKYLGQLPTVRIEKFLRVLQETMHGKSLDEALKDIEKDFTISHLEDMNKLSDEQLQRRKELMDINFEKNRVKFGDPDFVYDKQVHTSYFSLFLKTVIKPHNETFEFCRLILTRYKKSSPDGITKIPMRKRIFGNV